MKRLGAGAFGAVNLVESGDSSRAKVEMIVTFEKSLSTYLLELQVIEDHWYVCIQLNVYIYVFNKSSILCVYISLYVFLHVLSMYVCLFVCM